MPTQNHYAKHYKSTNYKAQPSEHNATYQTTPATNHTKAPTQYQPTHNQTTLSQSITKSQHTPRPTKPIISHTNSTPKQVTATNRTHTRPTQPNNSNRMVVHPKPIGNTRMLRVRPRPTTTRNTLTNKQRNLTGHHQRRRQVTTIKKHSTQSNSQVTRTGTTQVTQHKRVRPIRLETHQRESRIKPRPPNTQRRQHRQRSLTRHRRHRPPIHTHPTQASRLYRHERHRVNTQQVTSSRGLIPILNRHHPSPIHGRHSTNHGLKQVNPTILHNGNRVVRRMVNRRPAIRAPRRHRPNRSSTYTRHRPNRHYNRHQRTHTIRPIHTRPPYGSPHSRHNHRLPRRRRRKVRNNRHEPTTRTRRPPRHTQHNVNPYNPCGLTVNHNSHLSRQPLRSVNPSRRLSVNFNNPFKGLHPRTPTGTHNITTQSRVRPVTKSHHLHHPLTPMGLTVTPKQGKVMSKSMGGPTTGESNRQPTHTVRPRRDNPSQPKGNTTLRLTQRTIPQRYRSTSSITHIQGNRQAYRHTSDTSVTTVQQSTNKYRHTRTDPNHPPTPIVTSDQPDDTFYKPIPGPTLVVDTTTGTST